MQALVVDGNVQLTDLPIPEPGPGEALIRITTAGVCNTDIEILSGYMAFKGVPGHEFVGVVERCANEHLLGRRVVGEINCVCRACHFCRIEMPHHCANRTVLGIAGRNGVFAQYTTLPEGNLHLVPEGMPDEIAVFTEPAAAAFRITEQIEITANDRIIVLGDGKLGQLIAQVLWLRTKKLVCVGKHPWKLELLNRLHIRTARVDEPVEPGADIVVEATGSAAGLARALELVRPEGTVVLKTTVAGASTLELSLPVINEVRVVGSRCGPFRPALEALALGNIEVRPLISETFALCDGVAALHRATAPDVMKVLLRMEPIPAQVSSIA
ncbi:MAG: alcohol dehydrogenase catalytic domain-containing protein [Candidatus Hydrogenedentes bacterium]|nr:alcohol dehydrogenase catalytic domain-containing protein [Candidatus Hydrogenedentota bacterium]